MYLALCVSEAGAYRYKRNCEKLSKDVILSAAIPTIRTESAYNDNYGVPLMWLALQLRGFYVGLRRIRRFMLEVEWLHLPRCRPYGQTRVTMEIQEKGNLI